MRKFQKISAFLFGIWYLVFGILVRADTTYYYEIPLPGMDQATVDTATGAGVISYIRYIFVFAIGIVGIAALYGLIFGGIEYIVSSAVDKKQDAKDRIWEALLGLAIALGSWIILHTISPDLVSFNPDFGKIITP